MCIEFVFISCVPLLLPRLDRGAGNFYVLRVPNDRVAKINLEHSEELKAF